MMSLPKIFEKSVILLATLLSLATMQTESMALCSEESDSNICSKEPDYNKYRNPDYPNPTTVHLDIIIRNILDLDEEKHLFEIVASSNARWREKRIDIRSISVTNPQSVRPTEAELNEVWTTNPTYPNAAIVSKRFTYNTATRDKLSGSIWFKYTMVYKSFLTCAMDFSNYPFDSHICFWKLRSHYENTIDTEKLVIDTLQSEQDSKMASQDQPLIIDSNTLPYEIEISIGQEGIDLAEDVNKSTASVQFKFTRKDEGRNELLTGYFVPTGLFATLSLVSYLIKPEIVNPKFLKLNLLLFIPFLGTRKDGNVSGTFSDSNQHSWNCERPFIKGIQLC